MDDLRVVKLSVIRRMIGRQDSASIPVRNSPPVEVFADRASNPNADEASAAMGGDAAVNLAAGIWALKSERIRLAFRFNLGRTPNATSIG